jgi:hypothetical protein
MICFEADIKGIALEFFVENINILSNYATANELLKDICGSIIFLLRKLRQQNYLRKFLIIVQSFLRTDASKRFSNKH